MGNPRVAAACFYLADRLMSKVEGSRRAVSRMDTLTMRTVDAEARNYPGREVLCFGHRMARAIDAALAGFSPDTRERFRVTFADALLAGQTTVRDTDLPDLFPGVVDSAEEEG